MVTFPIGLGPTPDRPTTAKYSGDQSWREPPRTAERRPAPSGIDWEKDEKYFTPQPAAKRRFGEFRPENQRMQFEPDVPQPVVKRINVKAIPPATFYDEDGIPIPGDSFVLVPETPGVLIAIKNGDLERGPDPDGSTPQQTPRHRERERRQPSPPRPAE